MADLKLGNIKPVGADNVVVDGKYVKGGFVVVASTTERDTLKGTSGENIINGSLCYCTGDSKFYQYNGTKWVEKEFGTATEATSSEAGLMSAADKAKLDGIATEANKYVHPSTHAASMITGLATVATSGSYNDLADKPAIPADTNQKVKTGSVTFGANDTVEFVAGSNVSISGDVTNKKITISATDSYSHPKYDSKASGLYKITVDNGHVSGATAVAKSDITALGIPAQDTTYSNATADKDGLMSKTDKANLDTIVNSFNSDDADTTINTVKEVLKAFENAPEGTNIANALASKSNIGHNHETTTTAVLTGVKASGTDTFVKTINGGSGSLTSNTTTDGIKYVESVTHTAAALSGTTTFNTDAIKNVTLSASTADTDGPKYVESVTHTAATLSGTTTFNTDAIKSVALTETTTSTDGPKYVKSISGGSGSLTSGDTGTIKYVEDVTHTSASLTGDTTFVKTRGTFNPGTMFSASYGNGVLTLTPGATPSLSDATTGTVGISGGSISKTTKYLTHTHTAASATERYMKATGNAASTGTVSISGGSITPVTKYMKKTTTAASTGTVGISGGSITPSTKYLHHTHTAASAGSTGSAITGVASNGTVNAVTAIADAEN